MVIMKKIALVLLCSFALSGYAQENVKHFIFTSDVHFGLVKEQFRGQKNVSAAVVNESMAKAMNGLPQLALPEDSLVAAGETIKYIEAVIITGDLANRQEEGIQSAATSWQQFSEVYFKQLHLQKNNGQPSSLYLTAGNHDVSNAIGYHKKMLPTTDATAYIGIYNSMMHPSVPKTVNTFDYSVDKVHYSKDINGIHFQFINLWPDSAERVWMEKDLEKIPAKTPVLIFAHSIPDVEARFFKNPNGNHSINAADRFENLMEEVFKDGMLVNDAAVIEQKAWADFLRKHQNIKAYFHGHNNHTEYYTWSGPEHNVALNCIRVDSPMKGKLSAKNESQLSFELISIDSNKKILTVRECLWNNNGDGSVKWGASTHITL